MKKILVVFFGLIMILPFAACSSKKEIVPVSGISFYENEIQLKVGEKEQLQYKIFPSNATNKSVQFFSSDPTSVTVDDNGEVTLNKNQSAVITIRTLDGLFESTCIVSPSILPENIIVDETKMELKYDQPLYKSVFLLSVGQTKTLPILTAPQEAEKENLNISVLSGDANCLKIEYRADWLITGVSSGKCVLRIGYRNQSDKEIYVDVPVWVDYSPNNYEIYQAEKEITNYSSVSLELGASSLLRLHFLRDNQYISQTSITYIISDESIASVELINTVEQFNNEGLIDDIALFNTAKYIKITPKSEGDFTLYLLSDALDESGNPYSITMNFTINDICDELEVNVVSDYIAADGRPVVFVGSSFSLDVKLFYTGAESGLTEKRPVSIGNRIVNYQYSSMDACFEGVGSKTLDGLVVKTNTNLFNALENNDGFVSILVSVQKSIDSDEYVEKSVEFYVQNSIESCVLVCKYDYSVLIDGGEVVCPASVGSQISGLSWYLIDKNGEERLVMSLLSNSEQNSVINHTIWSILVKPMNDTVLNSDLVCQSIDQCEVVVSLSCGLKTITMSLIIHIIAE